MTESQESALFGKENKVNIENDDFLNVDLRNANLKTANLRDADLRVL